MLIRIMIIFWFLMVSAYSENKEKFFEIKLKSCSEKTEYSKFDDKNKFLFYN